MNEIIMDTSDVADFDGHDPDEPQSDLVATKESQEPELEFHISMQSFTKRDFYELMIEAAARQIVGRHGDRQIAKDIEAKCVELVNAKATRALDAVTSEIIEQPMIPSFGDKAPITMREFIGLYGREFLTTRVGHDGKPSTSGYDSAPRIERLVAKHLDRQFKNEIEKATNAAISEIQKQVKAQYDAMLAAEKKRLAEAIKALTGQA